MGIHQLRVCRHEFRRNHARVLPFRFIRGDNYHVINRRAGVSASLSCRSLFDMDIPFALTDSEAEEYAREQHDVLTSPQEWVTV